MTGSRHLRAVLGAVGVLLAATSVLGACGAGDTVAARDAARSVRRNLGLDSTQQACLEQRFDGDAAAARAATAGAPVPADERDALAAAVEACVPPAVLAGLLAATAPTGPAPDPGPGSAPPPSASASCVERALASLDAAARRQLVAVLANPAAVSPAEVAGTAGILDDACGLGEPATVPTSEPSSG